MSWPQSVATSWNTTKGIPIFSACASRCGVPYDMLTSSLTEDDTSVLLGDGSLEKLKAKAEKCLKSLDEWFKSNKLTLSTEKTFFIIYHTKRKQIHPQYDNLRINSSVIKRVTHVKYLGVFLDEHLSWDIHITYPCNSLAKYLSVFYNVRMMVPEKLKKQLYYSFVYSRIAYGIEVYGSCKCNTLLAKVQVMQNKLLKILYNKDRRYSTNTLHHELKLLQVKDIHELLLLKYSHCFKWKSSETIWSLFHKKETNPWLWNETSRLYSDS